MDVESKLAVMKSFAEEMVTEADEIEAAKALRNRLAEWKRREGGILS